MNGGGLFLGGMATFALIAITVKAQTGARRARAAADIARVVTSAVLVIVGVQWLVITHPSNQTLLWVVLGLPALLASYTLTKAPTIFEIRLSSHGRSDRR
jgi:hypothetical protein